MIISMQSVYSVFRNDILGLFVIVMHLIIPLLWKHALWIDRFIRTIQ